MAMPFIPRWEWRTFGVEFPSAEQALSGAPVRVQESAETYLLCESDAINTKIRGGILDIKQLHERRDGLELWSPVLKLTFPVAADALTSLWAFWQVATPACGRSEYSETAFLTDLVPRVPGVVVVPVSKTRRQAVVDDCTVELSTVYVRDRCVLTVAVESEAPERITALVRALGLSGEANVNYVVGLKRLMEGATS